MSKEKIILILGIWVTILPFLNFPNSWKEVFFVISGILLIWLAYSIQSKKKLVNLKIKEKPTTFTENNKNEGF